VRLIGAGRDAELFDLGGGRVLRRPRRPRPMDAEAAFMGRVRAAGYPAPEVFEVRPDGLVMERLEGPTMLDDLAAHPWRVGRHARTLAELHVRLHRIAAEDGLPGPFGAPVAGDVLVHGDLHPDNVVLASSGPVVIDWTNGGRGPAGADVADAWLVMAGAQPPPGRLAPAVVGLLRHRLLAVFLAHAGREEAERHLRTAARRRMASPSLQEAEKAAMQRVADVHGRR